VIVERLLVVRTNVKTHRKEKCKSGGHEILGGGVAAPKKIREGKKEIIGL